MFEAFEGKAFLLFSVLVVISCMTGDTKRDEFRLWIPGIALMLVRRVQVDEVGIATSTNSLLKVFDPALLTCPVSTFFTSPS